jgi:hypothetical protein
VKNLKLSTLVEPLDNVIPDLIDKCLSTLHKKIRFFLKENKLRIIIIKPGKLKTEEGHSYAYSLYNEYKIYITKPPTEIKRNIIHNIYHEIGHFVFMYLIGLSFRDTAVAAIITDFCKLSDKERGCTLFADKYMKNEYAKKLREEERHLIHNIDIKYHEQFAELYRTYMTCVFKKEKKWILPTKELQKLFLNSIIPLLS